MIDPKSIGEWILDFKVASDLLKSALGMMPKSAEKDAIETKIRAADEALKRADAKLAQELGYRLCQCTFPPQPMLWKQGLGAHVCDKCGNKISKNKPIKVATATWGRPR